jgi:hypothetical protein
MAFFCLTLLCLWDPFQLWSIRFHCYIVFLCGDVPYFPYPFYSGSIRAVSSMAVVSRDSLNIYMPTPQEIFMVALIISQAIGQRHWSASLTFAGCSECIFLPSPTLHIAPHVPRMEGVSPDATEAKQWSQFPEKKGPWPNSLQEQSVGPRPGRTYLGPPIC